MLGCPAKVAIRSVRVSDAAALAAVFRDSWQLAYAGIIPALHLERIIGRREEAWWLAASRSKDRHIVLEFEGKVGADA